MMEISIPASLVSSFINLHRFRTRYESFANLIERRFPKSMHFFLSEKQVKRRELKQLKKRENKNRLIDKATRGEIPLHKVPLYLRNQVRGIVDEKDENLQENQLEVSKIMNKGTDKEYKIIGSIDGIEKNTIIEFKSRKRYFTTVIRDKVQLMVYCICLKKNGILREKLKNNYRDTFYTYEEMLRFWKECVPVLNKSVEEFRSLIEGKFCTEQKNEIFYWLQHSNH